MTSKEINKMVRGFLSLPYVKRLNLARELGINLLDPYGGDAIEQTRLILVKAKDSGLLGELYGLVKAELEFMP